MQAKKRQVKVIPVPELKSHVSEIIVANGRSFQPFVRTFQYTGENITKSSLGTLIGIFEIDEINEDCAYIVNFLTSVAKKEYFSNPRRGAIESFESALHKINLALSELVKHGNVAWLGKLHGTIGVLEKNNFHFSVTGQAAILLLRNDDISDISAGLASPESHLHPLKTFVEVASGRLNMSDRILLTSPKLLTLFSIAELKKNAKRMDSERFLQFLKTALVNELDMAGTVLVEIIGEIVTETRASKKASAEKSPEHIPNIFSQAAFLPKKPKGSLKQEPAIAHEELPSEPSEDYIDAKTGHIYIQGETPDQPRDQHAQLEQLTLGLENLFDTIRCFLLAQKKWLRKGKKQAALAAGMSKGLFHVVRKKAARSMRRQWKKLRASNITPSSASKDTVISAPDQQSPRTTYTVSDIPLPQDAPLPRPKTAPAILASDAQDEHAVSDTSELPQFLKEKLVHFYAQQSQSSVTEPISGPRTQTGHIMVSVMFTRSTILVKNIMRKIIQPLPAPPAGIMTRLNDIATHTALRIRAARHYGQRLPVSKKRLVQGAVIACLIVLGAILFSLADTPSDVAPSHTLQDNAIPAPAITNPTVPDPTIVWDSIPEPVIATLIQNGAVALVTEKNILTVADRQSYRIPGAGTAKFASAMDDLGLIFVATDNGSLYAWSPISKTFVQNTLTLFDNATIAGIDTYLTYLYVLDSNNDQVYRFPRAANGFGSGTPWLKETANIDETAQFAVNESLFIAPDTKTIQGFFRGRMRNAFELPSELTITDLYTHPGLQNVYALDSKQKRIIIWNQDGKLIKEIAHESLSAGQTLSVNEKSSEILVSTGTTLLSYKLR